MRLSIVNRGKSLLTRFKFGVIRLLMRRRAPDALRVVWHRPAFFGKPFGAMLQPVMRGESSWTVGERELFAAFVSRKNECPF